jgi:ribosomal protein S27AE
MEWSRLTEEYRVMGDEELSNLAADFDDLTETAQQALRQEMQSRGLGDPAGASAASRFPTGPERASNRESQGADLPEQPIFPADMVPGYFGHSPKIVADDADNDRQDEASDSEDVTWKTVLCECETTDEAQYLVDALRKAGLGGWLEVPREFGRRYARVLVAADQLEQARAIAAQPIPQEIIDDSKEEIPEFVEPKCPKCGSDDVVLEGVDSENRWHCEDCGADWSDLAEAAGQNPTKAADGTS